MKANIGQLKNDKITELNNLRVEYQHLLEKKQNMEVEIKQSQEKLTAILQEWQGKETQIWSLNRNLSSQEAALNDCKKEIVIKQGELDKLKSEIDGQIAENKAKEENILGGIKNSIVQGKKELIDLNDTLKEKSKEKETLLESVETLRVELDQRTKELAKIIEETGRIMKEAREREIGLDGRAGGLNEWEKKLEFHHKRLQWIYKKLDMQLKDYA